MPTITVDPNTNHQTWLGWEANAIIGQNNPANTNWANWRQACVDAAVDVGVTRLRVGVRPGMENTTDYYNEFWAGNITSTEFNAQRYVPVNDNADPNVLNAAGFQWGELDHQMTAIFMPLKTALSAIGIRLWLNVCFTDFSASAPLDFKTNAAEYGEFCLAVHLHLRDTYGVVPDSWELLLEPDAGSDTWTAVQLADAAVAARSRLLAAGFTPYFIGPSTTVGPDCMSFYTAMKNHDANSVASIRELSWHEYVHNDNAGLSSIASFAATEGIKTSMLEFIGLSYGDALDSNWGWFQLLKFGKCSAIEQFALASTSAGDDGGKLFPINGVAETISYGSRTKFVRQLTKWIRREAVRKGATTDNTNFDAVVFRNPAGNYVAVCRTLTSGAFDLIGLPAGTYHLRYTTASAYDQALTDQTIGAGGTISTSMPAAGIMTIYSDPNLKIPILARGRRLGGELYG